MTTTEAKTKQDRKRLGKRGLVLIAIAILATFVFVRIADELREGDLDKPDATIELAVHKLSSPALDAMMIGFTNIGSGPCLIPVVLLTCVWAYRRGKKSYVVILIANTVIAMGLNIVLKTIFSRARPTLFDVIKRPDTYSFPSGHSMSSVQIYGAIATVAIALLPDKRWLFAPLAFFLMLGIGTSRVYLGVHWPSDVIAGWAAGVPFLVATVHLVHRAKQTQT